MIFTLLLINLGFICEIKSEMGCGYSSVNQNVVTEVAYCGNCGWKDTAEKLTQVLRR